MNSKIMRKILQITILISLIFSGCAGFLSNKSKPEIDVEKRYSKSELTEDLEFLFNTLEEIHPNLYLYTDKIVIDSLRTHISQYINSPLTSMGFWKLVAPAVAELGDGHTTVSLPSAHRKKYLDEEGKIIPFDVRIKGDDILVQFNYTSDSTLAKSSKVISINSVPSESILDDLRQYKSGEMASFVDKQIEWQFKPLLWAHYGFEGPFTIEYISSIDGQLYDKTFTGVTIAKLDSIQAKQNKSTSIYKAWTYQTLPDENIGIIDLNSFSDKKRFKKFLKSTYSEIQKEGIENLIIDIRNNAGGADAVAGLLVDYIAHTPWVLVSKAEVRINDQLLSDLPWFVRLLPIKPMIRIAGMLDHYTNIATIEDSTTEQGVAIYTIYTKPHKQKRNPLRFKGNTYLLINGGSYSMSVMFAAIIQDHGFGTLIGEETGQPANPYGGVYYIRLPNTQLAISTSAARAFRPSGEVTGRGVIPDYVVKQTPEDREKEIDTVLEFTKELIKKNE